jgi:hypothetical protein
MVKGIWISVDHDLPINELDEHDGNVIGVIAPHGDLNDASVELVHFDGEEWYDKGARTCTVTHWMPISIEYLK